MTDFNFMKGVLKTIQSQPHLEDHRRIPNQYIHSEWICECELSLPPPFLSFSMAPFNTILPFPLLPTGQLLLVIGFLPQEYSFYLNEENMSLQLMRYTIDMLEGVELAVTRSVIATARCKHIHVYVR